LVAATINASQFHPLPASFTKISPLRMDSAAAKKGRNKENNAPAANNLRSDNGTHYNSK